ncbi:MAG TPA: FliH/SctL family protein [Candidatus Acidoferrales bacterium]|jgi:flagellar assembly protein FliH|nr:FliH/SctL family protein [Candidatus Acidoferrales bacterium]
MSSESNVAEKLSGRAAEMFVYRPVAGDGALDPRSNAMGNEVAPALRAEIAKREQEAWQNGFAEGQAAGRTEAEKRLAENREAMAKTLDDFARARDEYFGRVEAEVVQLSLAIARKILDREAVIDPMLLTGLVHVALEKMGQESKTRLRAHSSQIPSWRDHFAQISGGRVAPELVADDSLSGRQCVLETELGSTEISLEGHLKEIEQGFFDLLAQRPRSA